MAQAHITKQMTIGKFEELFPTDDAYKAYLQARRWPVGVKCPRCGNGIKGKLPVVGAVSRQGSVVVRAVRYTDAGTLQLFFREAVSVKVDLRATDAHQGYIGLTEYPHEVVRNPRGEYVIGAFHTSTTDGFWSLIKRGIMSTHHKVSVKNLPLYVAEFEFRYNNRKNQDIFGAAVARC